MSTSAWGKFLKDRGGLIATIFLTAVFAVVAIELTVLAHRDSFNDADRSAAHYADDAKSDVAFKCARLTGQTRDDCADEITNAAREDQRNEYDLAAQQISAMWAAIMGGMAVLGVSLSALGVYLIWQTLAATRDTVEATWQIGKAQSNPYFKLQTVLFTVGVRAQDGQGQLNSTVKLQNIGQTPARNVKLSIRLHSETADFPLPELKGEQQIMMAHATEDVTIRSSPILDLAEIHEEMTNLDPVDSNDVLRKICATITLYYETVFNERVTEVFDLAGSIWPVNTEMHDLHLETALHVRSQRRNEVVRLDPSVGAFA